MLCEMSLGDLDFVAAMLGDPAVMRFYPKVYNREESAGWVRRQLGRYARDGVGLWLARDKSSGRAVGQVGLIRRPIDGRPETEIGWLIHRPYQRCGYASEGAAACRDYAFGPLGLPRVTSPIRPENLPSRGVAAKIGLTPAGRTVLAGFEHMVYAAEAPDARRAGLLAAG